MVAKQRVFKVRLCRDETESLDVIVSAEDRLDAVYRALQMSGKYGENLDGWELDDGNQSEVYSPGNNLDNVEEITDDAQ